MGCPIRISTDQRLLAAPRGFSQRATSFIASWCQGIHRMPFSCSRAQDPDRSGSNPSCTGTIHTRISPEADRTRTSMLELSLHTTNHRPSQPAIRQNASDRMCRRSLGCIPGATPQDLGRSDFAIPLPRLAPERRGSHPLARISHQRRAQRRTIT